MKFLFSTTLFLTTVLSLPHGEPSIATTSALFSVVAPSPISNATTSALFSVVRSASASSVPSSVVKAAPSSGKAAAATASAAVPSENEHDYNADDRKGNPPLPLAMDVKAAGSNASKPLNTTIPSGKPIINTPSGKPTPSTLPQQQQAPPQQKMGVTPSGKPVPTPIPSTLPLPQQKPTTPAPYQNTTLPLPSDNGYSDSEDDNKAFLANKVAGYSKEGGLGDKTVSVAVVSGGVKAVNGTGSAGGKEGGKDGGKEGGKDGGGGQVKSTADLIPDSRVEA